MQVLKENLRVTENRWVNDTGKMMMRAETLEDQIDAITRHLERLAVALMEKHYPEATTWRPASENPLMLIDQIDNMTCGLERRATKA
jgi:D-tyrosyl-tRNA(Tyr) deacylase